MSFSAQVERMAKVANARMIATFQQSTQEVINTAQTPTAQGGRIRVDTGFLRNSGRASLVDFPVGPTRPQPGAQYDWSANEQDMVLTVANAELGDTVYFGWTADYARIREVHDGFLQGAVKDWPQIVSRNAASARARIK